MVARRRAALGGVAALAALTLVVVVAFRDVVAGGRTLSAAAYVPGVLPSGPVGSIDPPHPPPVRDLEGAAWVDEPAPYLVHAALAQGRLPLWSVASGLGAPLLGNPNTGALAPLQWIVNLWPSPWVQDLAWLSRVLVLGLSTWLLATRLGAGAAGALTAAVALMLSGQTIDWIDHHPLNTDAFVPLALAAALRLPHAGRRGVALLAAAVAAGLLGVKPQSALVAGAFGAAWIAAEARDRRRARRAEPPGATTTGAGGVAFDAGGASARLAASAAGVALGAALAAVALVPFAETFSEASGLVRAGRTSQSAWALAPGAWPALIGGWAQAALAAAPGTGLAAGLPHAGASVLVLAALGAWWRRRRRLVWALVATIAFYLLKTHGLFPLTLAAVPLVGSVSFVKYCFPLYLALALLAGLAVGAVAERRRGAAWALAAVCALELVLLARRERPERRPLYAPAAYVDALRALGRLSPGRISGPVDLAPPLVSGALGFRDLRAIDVLTPRATWETLSSLVAPSQGVTWILADPDPLLAATSPAAALTDLRWVLARAPLEREGLASATRSLASARRLVALFSALDRFAVDTASLSAGIRDLGGDRRFHWTCTTPCRFALDLARLPERFAAGLGTEEPGSFRVRLVARTRTGEEVSREETVHLAADATAWRDLFLAPPGDPRGAAVAGTVEIEIESDAARRIFVGGIGPSPGEAEEGELAVQELAARRAAFDLLELRWSDATAHVYATGGSYGRAYLAERVAPIGPRGLEACVVAGAGARVACLDRAAAAAAAAAGVGVAAGEGVEPGDAGDAFVVADAAGSSAVATAAARTAVLVFARLFYPGWRATIDGEEVAPLRVNGALLGVVVPPGVHWVEVAYRPASVAAGAAISVAGALVWLALILAPRAPRRGRFEGIEGRR